LGFGRRGAVAPLFRQFCKLAKMSEEEIYAQTPVLGPDLTAQLLDERKRLQNPDALADAEAGFRHLYKDSPPRRPRPD